MRGQSKRTEKDVGKNSKAEVERREGEIASLKEKRKRWRKSGGKGRGKEKPNE